MTSDSEVKRACINSNCSKLKSDYLLKYFYSSDFDDVPFVISSIVFWFVVLYINQSYIRFFKEFKFIPV